MPHTHNKLDSSLFRLTRRLSALLQADAELRTRGVATDRAPPARELPYTARALACHFTTDRASVSISFLPLLRAFEAHTQFGPLRTLHQGQLGDRRGPLRATADWRGTYSDLDHATARCTVHQTDSTTGNGRPSTLRKPPTTPAAKTPMVSYSLVLVSD